jgi:hypothetical protein
LERLASSDGREDQHRLHLLASTIQFLECGERDRVERNGSRVSVLGLGEMDLPAFKADLAPTEAVCSLIRIPVWMDKRK